MSDKSADLANSDVPYGTDADATVDQRERKNETDFLRFDLLRSAIYHDEREQTMSFRNRASAFLTIILGSSVIAAMAESFPQAATVFAALTVVNGAAVLVFDYAGSARDHRDLKRRFYEMLSEIEEEDRNLRDIRRRMTLAYADEPPIMHALNAVAHNRAGETLFADDFDRVSIGWFARTLRNWIAFRAQSFPSISSVQ